MSISKAGLAVAAVLLAGSVAGCGDDAASSSGGSGSPPAQHHAGFNEADVSFAQHMIPHHEQAIEMAKLIPTRTKNPDMLKISTDVQKTQLPEIKQMSAWLEQWHASAGHSEHREDAMGMQPHDHMKHLSGARGHEFDHMWLEMMIDHHAGAIKMAKTELKTGSNPEAKALAQRIIDAQTAEIAMMRKLLKQKH